MAIDPYAPELRRAATTGDPLSQWQRDIVGRSVRLDVPLVDPVGLRAAAEILRQYANRLEVLSGQKGEAWRILHSARGEGAIVKHRLQSIRRAANETKAKTAGYSPAVRTIY